MSKHPIHRCCAILAVIVLAAMTTSAQESDLSGTLGAHDPSTLIKYGGRYYYFCTGQGIAVRRSSDMNAWSSRNAVFSTAPAWTTAAIPGFTGNFWAPEISYFGGLYHLYYAVSTFGSQVSAIGMATNTTLDGSTAWTDQGPVIQSTTESAYNTIDPSILQDPDGRMWMTFGSFWNGIYQVEIDPATGLRKNSNTPVHLAYNSQIEASYEYKRGDYYYLFVNWGTCCQGVNSTYNIRVGRSSSANGPFLDENGFNMLTSNGSLFLGTQGDIIGPGQIGIFSESGLDWFSYHYYDGANNGSATYNLQRLYWTPDGWPSATFVTVPADFNGDGMVDIRDLSLLAAHLGGSGGLAQGDANGDGQIDATDLGILAHNWQAGVIGPSSVSLSAVLQSVGLPPTAVPEPAAASLFGLICTGLLRRRR